MQPPCLMQPPRPRGRAVCCQSPCAADWHACLLRYGTVMTADTPQPRRLRDHYCGWLTPDPGVRESAFRSGLVVVDANILLALYEVGADAREEVLAILEGVANRIWVPHQVVIEYSRNRRRVVEARVHNFTDTRRSVKAAEAAAIKALTDAIAKVEKLRTRNRTTRAWSLVDHSLDDSSLKKRLDGVVDCILAEVDLLGAEHDLTPGDVVAGDPVYDRVDHLLSGRIGQPVGEDNLRRLVELAIKLPVPE